MKSPTFDHFALIEDEAGNPQILGSGGMGVTYRAWDTHLAREVALKVIRPVWLEEPSAKTRFIREARALAQIQHPNVVGIVHLGETEDGCYYTMEFINGCTLEDRIKDSGPLDVPWALFVGRQIALALHAASKRDIVHRDVKPANIMLIEDDDEGLIAKLIDFGLARNFLPESDESNSGPLTLEGSVLGTPQYSSPEQIDEQELDVRSDIYSLGICMYFALSGSIPFTGTTAKVMHAQVFNEPDWSKLSSSPKPVLKLLKRMLRKNPDERFGSAYELYVEMDALLREAMRGTIDDKLSSVLSLQSDRPDSERSDSQRQASGSPDAKPSRWKHPVTVIGIVLSLFLAAGVIGKLFFLSPTEEETAVEMGDSSPLVFAEKPKSGKLPAETKETAMPDTTGSKEKTPNSATAVKEKMPSETIASEPSVPKPDASDKDSTKGKEKAKASPDVVEEKPTKEKPESEDSEPEKSTPKAPAQWELVAKNAGKVRDALEEDYTNKLSDLNENYLNALTRILDAKTKAAKLDEALVIDREIKRIKTITINTATEAPVDSMLPDLNRTRRIYIENAAPIYNEFVVKRDAVLEAYEGLLDEQEAKLQANNRAADLERLRKVRAELFPAQ